MAYTVLLFFTLLIVKAAMVGTVYMFGPIAALVIIPLAYFAATRLEPHR